LLNAPGKRLGVLNRRPTAASENCCGVEPKKQSHAKGKDASRAKVC